MGSLKLHTAAEPIDLRIAICGAIRTSVVELLNMGIADIWMRASESDLRFHNATVLGISMVEWNILAPNSGLFKSNGTLSTEDVWRQRLQLSLTFRKFKPEMRMDPKNKVDGSDS